MKRVRQPFFRPCRDVWYVQLDGKQINLGPDKDQAWARYYELMALRAKQPTKQLPPSQTSYVASVLDQYLAWLDKRVQEGTKAKRTYDWYFDYIQSFLHSLPATLTIDRLQPIHVYEWVDGKPSWKSGKRGAMTSIQRAFNWAARAGLLKAIGGQSPIAFLEKPAQGRREQLVSEQEYLAVLSLVHDQEFRDLLELSWDTGCRPHELFTVQAAYVDVPSGRWIFPVRQSKGKRWQRVVFLTDKALEITRRLILMHPEGSMLRNTAGKAWCVSSVSCRFQRLRDKLGKKYNLYAFRHTFLTNCLVNGLDAVTTATLAGHRDTVMLSRHYAHLLQKPDYMRDAVRRAKGA